MANSAVVEPHTEGAALKHVVSGPERLGEFLKDTRQEMRKVTTPTRAEVQTGTIVVVITVFLFAAYFELVDLIFGKGIDQVLQHLTRH